jgi:hypothetical protein
MPQDSLADKYYKGHCEGIVMRVWANFKGTKAAMPVQQQQRGQQNDSNNINKILSKMPT